jgi:polysaccharide pyruvyl transferase WcaK-like protein
MYSNPLVVGVRQSPNWIEPTTIEQTLINLGHNTGNMMFTEALCQVVDGAKRGSFGLQPAELEGRDAIVLAAANWVNNFEDFGWLADRLEAINLPVFLVGIGAQSSTDLEVPKVSPGTMRLLHLVQERSTSISVRGDFSCQVLHKLGIKNVHPTGCPSMMLAGQAGLPHSLVDDISFDRCSMHATRHLFNQTDAFQVFLYRQAFARQIDLILQSELADIYFSTDTAIDPDLMEKASKVLRDVYGTNDIDAVSQFLRNHGKVFSNYNDWIAYMKSQSFCFGTRIHGTIAAIIAGTPATLIAHDSRTIEMAQKMGIPYVESSKIPTSQDLDIANLYSLEKMYALVDSYKTYYENFAHFLRENNLGLVSTTN